MNKAQARGIVGLRVAVAICHYFSGRGAVFVRMVCARSGVVAGVMVLLCFVLPGSCVGASRVYELVSPLEKNGSVAGASNQGEQIYTVAEADGDGVVFGGLGAVGETSSGLDLFTVARRGASGWGDRAAMPRGEGAQNLFKNGPEDFAASADLSLVSFTAQGSFAAGDPDNALVSGSLYQSREGAPAQWAGQPLLVAPDPVLGNGLRTGVHVGRMQIAGPPVETGGVSTLYFGYYGTLLPEDASRAEVESEQGGANSSGEETWGFYESRGGALIDAGMRPDGTFSPFGAFPAAIDDLSDGEKMFPADYDNDVSGDGTRAFFVSPRPGVGAPADEPPELYVHESPIGGAERPVLVSRSELPGSENTPAPHGPVILIHSDLHRTGSYAFASADGSRVVFGSVDRLTGDAPATGGVREYLFDLAKYEADIAAGVSTADSLRYLPGVSGPVLAWSEDDTRFVFYNTISEELDLWSEGTVSTIARIPRPRPTEGSEVDAVRLVAGGNVVVFQSNGLVPGDNTGGFSQVYRFDVAEGSLSCVSCPPVGVTPSGDARLSEDDNDGQRRSVDDRGVSSDGSMVFFDTPDPLVPQDVNGRRDVYEWTAGGGVSLVSSGTGSNNSYFLDNGVSGEDVFFSTSDELVPGDTDGGYDVYDAREGGGFPIAAVPVECVPGCQGPVSAAPVFGVPGSESFSGPGNPALPESPAQSVVKSKSKQKAKPKKKKKKGKGKGRARRSRARTRASERAHSVSGGSR
jgi:hypothetical protein